MSSIRLGLALLAGLTFSLQAEVYYADPGTLTDGNLYVDIPTNVSNIRGVYIVGKRGDMETAFWAPRTNDWQPFLNSFGFVMAYRTQGEAICPEERDVPQKTLAALTDIAGQSGHPELAHAPVFIFGFSGDAAGPAAMADVYPDRTLGGVMHSTAYSCNYGSEESQTNHLYFTPTMEINCALDSYGWQLIHLWTTMSNYNSRTITGSVAWTHVQQGGAHGAAMNRTTMQFPWLLAVAGQRLPADTTPYTNLPTISRLNTNYLWRGDQGNRGLFWTGSYWSNFDTNGQSRTVGSFKIWPATNANPAGVSSCPTMSAMPDEAYARVWQAYCDMTNAAVTPSGNDAALAIQTVALMPMETNGDEESGKKLRFAFVRSRKTPSPLNVGFSLSGTASNGVDYALITNFTCTIPGNEWTGYLEIEPLDDLATEGTESVVVALTPNTNQFYTHSPSFIAASLREDETSNPVVTALNPTNNASSFIATNLVLTFSRNMVKGTGTITVSNLTDGILADTFDASSSRVTASGTTVTLSLTNYLDGPKLYAVTIASNALQDTQGHPFAGIASSNTWRFTAVPYETNPPLPASSWPSNGATAFNRFETLRLTFNESVQSAGGLITISNLTLSRNVERISVDDPSRVTFSGSNVFIQPTHPLAAGNAYCVRIEPGVITDLFPPAPNPFAGFTNNSGWFFSTKTDPGTFIETFDTENAVADPTFTTNLYGAFGGVSNVQYNWYKLFSATGSGCQLISGNGVVLESPNGGASQIATEFLPSIGSLNFQLLKALPASVLSSRVRVNVVTRNSATNQLINYYDYEGPGIETVTASAVPVNQPVKIEILKLNGDLETTLDNLSWTPYLPADTNAPAPTFLPGTGSIALPTTQVFVVRFAEDIQAADGSVMNDALALAAFSLTNVLTGAAVPFSAVFDYELGLPQVTITPTSPLAQFTSYQLALKPNAVRDLNGITNTAGARALLTTAPSTRYIRETFGNNNASTNSNPNLWGGGSFVGDESFSWSYNSVGSASYASGAYQLDNKGMVLRGSGSNSMITAVNVPGGVGSFMVVFRNGDGSTGARKLALDVAGQHYESVSADSADATLFRVDNINEAGNENTYNTIILSNATAKSTTIDSIVWTTYRDPLQVLASTTALTVAEGGSAPVTLTLNRYPDSKATVTVQRASGSTNVTTATVSFVLDEANWNTGTAVSFDSGEDPDVLNDAALFVFSASDVVAATVTVTQTDNDVGPEVSATNLIVREGSTNSVQLRLTKLPTATTTVTVSRVAGDTDLAIAGASTFVFSTSDWATWQTLSITAAADADATDGEATFSIASSGVTPVLVSAAERDAAWTNWVAFHDLHPTNNGDAASTTLGFTHGAAFGLTNALTTQRIDGVSLTLRYFDKNGVEKPTSAVLDNSALANPANGTHAATLFTNYVKPNAVYTLQSTTDYAVVTVSGLQADRKYGIGLFINRGAYTPRARFTLQDATNFTAAGSAGIGDCSDGDPATYEVEVNNTTRGYVAMWTNLTPTGNGGTSFSVKQDHFPLTTGTTLRIAQAIWITGEMPPANTNPPPVVTNTLTVVSTYGTPVPSSANLYTNGSVVSVSVGGSPVDQGTTQIVATGWAMSGNSPTSGSATNFTLTLTNNTTLTWLWQTNVQFTRSATANGSVTGPSSGWYALGASITVTAVPNSGFSFAGWSGDITGSTNSNPLTIALDRTRSITANFATNEPLPAITNTLTVASTYGTPVPSSANLYTNGSVVSVSVGGSPVDQGTTQIVATGWAMSGNSPTSGSATNFSLTLTNDATLTWQWQTNVLLQAAAGANGSVSSTGGWYALGGSVTVTAAANSGYAFAGWSGDVSGNTNALAMTVTLDRSRSLSASFAQLTTITVTNILRVDFGLTNAPVEANGSFQEFPMVYTTSTKTTNRVYTLGTSNVTVGLGSGGGFTARDRGSPSSDSGARTYSDMYRDLITASSGNITMTVSGLRSLLAYTVRTWTYDNGFVPGGAFTNWDITSGSVLLGVITNVTGAGGLPTNNTMYSISSTVTSDANGQFKLLFQPASNTSPARLNGLELIEVVTEETSGGGGSTNYTLSISSVYGATDPAPGLYTNAGGDSVTCSVTGSVQQQTATSQVVCAGWTGTGSVPASGAGTSVTFTITADSTIAWQWQTNFLLQAAAAANGSVSTTGGWYRSTSNATVTATPDSGYAFAGWSGNVAGANTNGNPLTLAMTQARSIIASFATNTAPGYSSNVLLVLNEFPVGTAYTNQMIPMRDGVRLSTHIFLPAGHGNTNYPVVLVRSAYNDWNQRRSYANDVVDRTDTNNLKWINTNGYVYVFQDLRGDGESEVNAGFEPRLSENEIHDTYDTVEALATNAWSNGRVGMYGSSGHGMAAYMGWLSKAPHLVVAAPGNTAPNLYDHWAFENGVRRWIYRWLSFRNQNGAAMPEWPRPTLGDYYTNAYWPRTLREAASGNTTILKASDSWHNFFLDSTFETFGALAPTQQAFLTMDHGTHQGDIGLTFTPKPSGFFNPPNVFEILDGVPFTNTATLKYFVMGDARRTNSVGNYYRLANRWPPPAATTPFYLHADGALSPTLPTSSTASLSYSYHPTNPVPTVGGNFSYGTNLLNVSGPLNQLDARLTNRTDILRFETAPLTNAVEITGCLQARLFVSTDVEDTLFTVKLIDIYPAEGTNEEYHAIMRESAIMGRYWSGFASPAPLVSGQVYRLDIDLSSISLLVETNHRIGVHITSSSDQAFEVHPNTFTPVASFAGSPTAHNTLHLNTQYPSMIRLPLYDTNLPSVVLSTSLLAVAEGGTNSFTVQLDHAPAASVTVAVERISGDAGLAVASGGTLVFTPSDWSTPQMVALAGAQDADGVDELADFEIAGPGAASAVVQVQETDDDPWITASPANLMMAEGTTGTVGIALSRAPGAPVTVTVSRVSGDIDLQSAGATNFVFNAATWSTTQTVSFSAVNDADAVWGTALFRFSAAGAFSTDITLRESDDEPVLLLVDFGITNSLVETNGDWQAYGAHATAEPTPSSRTYAVGPSNIIIGLSSSGTLSGRDRSNPSAYNGALTIPAVYRDCIQTSVGDITLTISNLMPSTAYQLRSWHYDYSFADAAVFTVSNYTGGAGVEIGRVTNQTGSTDLPTNDVMYSCSAAVTSSPAGTLTLKINGGIATSGRINGLELEEVSAAPVYWTLQVVPNNPAWGSVSPTGGTYAAGTQVTLTPAASNYYHFTNWSGSASGSAAPLLVTVNSNSIITANFAASLAVYETPHWWLAQNGFPASDAGAQQTGANGMAAWESFVAGVAPQVSTTTFEVARFNLKGVGQVLSWPAVTGRTYTLLWAPVVSGPYTTTVADTLAIGSCTDTVHGAEAKGFYQLRVRLTP